MFPEILKGLSLFCGGFGVIILLTFTERSSRRESIPMALDLWMAGGLLRLSATGEWSAIAVTALIIIIRKFVSPRLTPLSLPN